ncbi:thioesterase II family protein [Streptomyces otsuchiensis]|uniref:thioesterase II family protein n=1 Tax=Streptomyces otsuchiensis TaxID=2681388 RepID=UPI0010311D68|nr:alpha/beta fold hydrolase [Streptomyces otsuchiensis]
MSHSPDQVPAPDDVVWRLPGSAPVQRTSLLVLAHSGGNAHAYSGWRAHLPEDVTLLVGQYPGRGARFSEELPGSLDDLAGPILAALPPGTGDLVVLGHSMGSLVAFEIARRLTEAGRPPRALIASACRAPFLDNPSVVLPERLDDDQLVAAIKERGGTDDGILDDPELREIVLPAIRADFGIDDVYRFDGALPAVDCPVTVLGGEADTVAPPEMLAPWAEVTSGGCVQEFLPGGHFYFQQQLDAFFVRVNAVLSGVESAAAPAL